MTTDQTNPLCPVHTLDCLCEDETPEAPPAREPLEALDRIAELVQQQLVHDPNNARLLAIEALALGIASKGPRIDPPGQPTEPPPLPELRELFEEAFGLYYDAACSEDYGRTSRLIDDATKAQVRAMAALLGLTAPAADVRVLLEEALKRQSMSTLNYATDVSALRCAITEALALLTGKGAPL